MTGSLISQYHQGALASIHPISPGSGCGFREPRGSKCSTAREVGIMRERERPKQI